MSEWVEILRAPVEQDLAPFCRFLRHEGVAAYVFERDGEQCLCVEAPVDERWLQQLVDRWNQGDVGSPAGMDEEPRHPAGTVFAQWWQFPLTALLCLLSLLAFLLVATPWGQDAGGLQWLALLALQPFEVEDGSIRLTAQLPALAEAWRYWTPIFLHFSVFHILFNSLMLLELGRRIEMLQGSLRLLFLVMACGLVSNVAQFYSSPETLFGGMSGVIYALVGYSWLYQRLVPRSGLAASAGLMVMALVWLVLCFSGLVTLAGMGQIANAAHVGGLLAGMVLAGLLAWLDRRWPGM